MKATHWLVIVMILISSLLSACGQTGLLYMPDEAPQQEDEQKR